MVFFFEKKRFAAQLSGRSEYMARHFSPFFHCFYWSLASSGSQEPIKPLENWQKNGVSCFQILDMVVEIYFTDIRTCKRAKSESLAMVRKLLVGDACESIFLSVGLASSGSLSSNSRSSYKRRMP